MDLPPTFVFDYPSVQEMTAAIVQMRPRGSHNPEINPATDDLTQRKALNHRQNVLDMVRGLPIQVAQIVSEISIKGSSEG